MTEPRRRLGIRLLLLALLLPGIIALLALDTWNDYRAISRVVVEAYDRVLVEPVQALNDSVSLDASGQLHVEAAFSVQAMFESTHARHQQLHVGYTRMAMRDGKTAANGTEETLIGNPDLPPPPPAADDTPIFYDAVYQGYPVRIAALWHTVQLTPDTGYRVLSQAAEGTAAREQALADSWHQALRNDARVVLLIVVLVWLGVAISLRPLERVRRSLAARAPGDLEPLDLRGVPHEIAPLVEAVNLHMASQSRLLAAQSRFLADASHQLRTPLAIMMTQAGYALRERDPAQMRETLRAIIDQLARARRLSEQLLSLAHANDAAPASGGAPPVADLNAVARDVVLQYLPLAHEKNQDLGFVDVRGDAVADDTDGERDDSDGKAPPSAFAAPVAADAAEVHEALSNLVHNAIKYTPVNGRITVAVRLAAGHAEAEVCDTGPGIPASRRAAVFERFTRHAEGAGAQASNSRGAGLGLAIAHAYARRNGGEIVLGDAPAAEGSTGGLCATLRLHRVGSNPISDNTYFEEPLSH